MAAKKLLVLVLFDIVLWLASSVWNASVCPGGSSNPSCFSSEQYVASTVLGEGSFIALPVFLAVFLFVAVREASAESKKYVGFTPSTPDPEDELVLTDVWCGLRGKWNYGNVWAKADLHFTRRRVYLAATERTKPQLWSVGYAKATYLLRRMINGFSVEYSQMKRARLYRAYAMRNSPRRRLVFKYSTGTRLIDVRFARFLVDKEQFEKLRTSLPAIIPASVELAIPESPEP